MRNRGRTCSDSYCFAAFSGVEVRGPRPRFLGSGASPWLRWSRRCSEGSYHESVYWSVNHCGASLCRVKMNRALKRSGRDTLDVEAQTPQVLTGAVHKICVCSYQIKQRVTRDEALQAIRRDFVHVLILHPPTLRAARRGCLGSARCRKAAPRANRASAGALANPPGGVSGIARSESMALGRSIWASVWVQGPMQLEEAASGQRRCCV